MFIFIFSAGFMSWEITHNLDILFGKDETQANNAAFDLQSINVNVDGLDLTGFLHGQ